MNEDMLNEMASRAALITALADADDAGALIIHPYGGPPPGADFFLGMMKVMIEETGDAIGVVCLGLGPESGMVPLLNIHPVDALHEVLHLRLADKIPSIDWVAIAFDTYVRLTTDTDAARGDATKAFKAGDPNAYEALCAICVAPDGPGYDIQQRYVRSEDSIEWDEPKQVDSISSTGDIPVLMQQLVTA